MANSQSDDIPVSVPSGVAFRRNPAYASGLGEGREEFAIVLTDLPNSTALCQRLGEEAMEQVRISHFARSKELIEQFNGLAVKNIGDSSMVVFKSVDRALGYAKALQQNPGNPQLEVRVGIRVGKMTADGEFAAQNVTDVVVSQIEQAGLASEPGFEQAKELANYRRLVERVGDVFGDEVKASRWLSLPNADLDGETPLQSAQKDGYLGEFVEPILIRIEHGIYY